MYVFVYVDVSTYVHVHFLFACQCICSYSFKNSESFSYAATVFSARINSAQVFCGKVLCCQDVWSLRGSCGCVLGCFLWLVSWNDAAAPGIGRHKKL